MRSPDSQAVPEAVPRGPGNLDSTSQGHSGRASEPEALGPASRAIGRRHGALCQLFSFPSLAPRRGGG